MKAGNEKLKKAPRVAARRRVQKAARSRSGGQRTPATTVEPATSTKIGLL